MSVLNRLNNMHKKVEDGEIKGVTKWSVTEGECLVTDVALEENVETGKAFFTFKMQAAGEGPGEFGCRVPNEDDKNGAIFMAMQTIYKTVYPLAGKRTDEVDLSTAYELARKACPMRMHFELSEYENVSQKDGKVYINQRLERLVRNENSKPVEAAANDGLLG